MPIMQKMNVQYTVPDEDVKAYESRGFKRLGAIEKPTVDEKPLAKMDKAELVKKAEALAIDIPSPVPSNAALIELIEKKLAK